MRMMAIAHRVEAREVRERLAGAEHVVGADGGRRIGQLDLDDLGTESLELRDALLEGTLDLGRETVKLEQGGHDANAHAVDAHVEVCGVVDVAGLARAIERVTSRDGVEGEGGILDTAGERPDLVK